MNFTPCLSGDRDESFLRRSMKSVGVFARVMVCVGALGCEQPPPPLTVAATPSPALQRLLDDSTNHLLHVGHSDHPQLFLARIAAARVTPSGSRLVVADGAPPFVRVFGETGDLISAFFPEGEGPGEATRVHSIAVTDTTILVHHSLIRLDVVSMDGTEITSHRLSSERIMNVAGGCTSDWLAYGIDGTWGDGNPKPWLHLLELSDDQPRLRAFPMELREPSRLSIGLPSLVVNAEGGALYHRASVPDTVLQFSCTPDGGLAFTENSAPSAVLPRVRGDVRNARQGASVGGDQEVMQLGPGVSIPAGIAPFQDGLLVIETRSGGPSEASSTDVWYFVQDTVYASSVVGRFSLLDAQPEVGVLFGSSHFVPRVFLISADSLATALRDVPGVITR